MQNGIIWCNLQEGFEVFVNGEIIGFHLVEAAALRMFKRAGGTLPEPPMPQPPTAPALALPAALPVARLEARQTVTERHSAAQPRCRHYRAIKACFAVFIARGLPTDDEAMRATLGRLLERDVPTRKTLTAADWEAAASAARWLPA
jgi:hypothetical protein